jgi:hypothetical protein
MARCRDRRAGSQDEPSGGTGTRSIEDAESQLPRLQVEEAVPEGASVMEPFNCAAMSSRMYSLPARELSAASLCLGSG